MFLTDRTTRTDALEAWRDAARLVSTRWEVFREADAESRPWAFASYVAALDAEEAAAAEWPGFFHAGRQVEHDGTPSSPLLRRDRRGAQLQCRRSSRNVSNCSRDSHRLTTRQPPSTGPAIRSRFPAGGLVASPQASVTTASNAELPPGSSTTTSTGMCSSSPIDLRWACDRVRGVWSPADGGPWSIGFRRAR